MPPEDQRAAAMLEELAWLRARLERVRSLPAGAFFVEGIVVAHDRVEPAPGSVREEAIIVSTIGTWRLEQSHEADRTARWTTRITLTPIQEEDTP